MVRVSRKENTWMNWEHLMSQSIKTKSLMGYKWKVLSMPEKRTESKCFWTTDHKPASGSPLFQGRDWREPGVHCWWVKGKMVPIHPESVPSLKPDKEIGLHGRTIKKVKTVIPVSPVPVRHRLPACLGNLQPVIHWTEMETLLSSSSEGGSTAQELQKWILNGWFHKQGFRGFKGEKGEPGLPGLDGLDAPCPVVWRSFFPFSMPVLSMITSLSEGRNMYVEVWFSCPNLLTTYVLIYSSCNLICAYLVNQSV